MFGAVVIKKRREVKQLTAVFDVVNILNQCIYINIIYIYSSPLPLLYPCLFLLLSQLSHQTRAELRKACYTGKLGARRHGCIHRLFSFYFSFYFFVFQHKPTGQCLRHGHVSLANSLCYGVSLHLKAEYEESFLGCGLTRKQ